MAAGNGRKGSYRPMGNRLFVRRDAATSRSGAGLHLPAQAQRAAIRGTVTALGDGWDKKRECRVHFDVEVGDRVLFSPNIGTEYEGGRGEIDVPGAERLLVVREDDLIGVEEEGQETHLMPAKGHKRIGPARVLRGAELET